MTLKEIAQEAGVSVSTVSRVINNKNTNVARPEVQRRIREIALRTGYGTTGVKQGLTEEVVQPLNKKQGVIACVFGRISDPLKDPFFSLLAQGIETAASQQNFSVRHTMTAVNIREPGVLEAHLSDDVQGIVVLGRCDDAVLKALRNYLPNVVFTGLTPAAQPYDQVICDGSAVSGAAVDYLVSLGHKRIAYIGEKYRCKGYISAMERHSLNVDDSIIIETSMGSENGYLSAMRLLSQTRNFTAILCGNDLTAIGAMRALGEEHISIPEKISVIGIDDIALGQYLSTQLTTVHVPIEEMGRVAAKLLIDRINGGHQIHQNIQLPFHVIPRESCDACSK